MNFKKWLPGFSWVSIFLVLITALLIVKETGRWKEDRIVVWDIKSYYCYVPATFIYHDLTFTFINTDTTLQKKIWTEWTPEGRRVVKMSSGLGVMYTPFFLVAHGIALSDPVANPPTGYGKIYDLFLLLSDVFYTVVGLIFLRKILKKLQINDWVIGFTILALYFGSNLLYYSIYEVMSHNYLFCLLSILIWKIMQWHETPVMKHAVLIGLVLGLMTLTRPVNVIFGVIFLLYGVSTIKGIKEKFNLLLSKWGQVLVMGICLFAVVSIQMMYWKYSTGHWLYWSYTNEGFHFNKPHILDGLFSFRKGWYVYSPVMILATIGFFLIPRYEKKFMIALPVAWMLFTYIIFSWWCWWYGGGFGARPYIDLYAIMGIALACLFQWIWEQKKYVYAVPCIMLVSFCCWYSCFKTYQAHVGILHWDSMTYKSWRLGLFQTYPPEQYWKEMKTPDYDKACKTGEE